MATDRHAGNHLGYRQTKGTQTSPEELAELYAGLKQNYLTDFDVMLTGYAPNAQSVDAIGAIGRDLKLKASTRTGSFFWVLDPVMGDDGRVYVNEDVIPAYRSLMRDADLILPNQFEAEYGRFQVSTPLPLTQSLRLLSGVKITCMSELVDAISRLHKDHRVPHVIVTSVRFDASSPILSVVGSSSSTDGLPRVFKIDIPALDCFFSGTGDMFAALIVVRLREAVSQEELFGTKSWRSPDNVGAPDLPLAKATEKVLGSMHAVLAKTKVARDAELEKMSGPQGAFEKDGEKRLHLRKTKAAEVRLVRNLQDLIEPDVKFQAQALEQSAEWNPARLPQSNSIH
ncbi:MAG: hypothetical protein Q9193_000154 [Seirophora villosa]